MTVDNLKRKATVGVVWSAMRAWGGQLVTFSVFIILARQIEPREFGLVAFVATFLAVSEILVRGGMAESLIQRPEFSRELAASAFWANIAAGALACLSLLVGSFYVPVGDFGESVRPIVRWLAFGQLMVSFTIVPEAMLRRELRYAEIAGISLTSSAVGGIAAIALAIGGGGAYALVANTLCASATKLILMFTRGLLDYPRRLLWSDLRDLQKLSVPILVTNLLTVLATRMDRFVIGGLLGAVELGRYVVAYQFLTAVTQALMSPVTAVAMPALCRMQGDLEMFSRTVQRATQAIAIVALPCYLGICALAPEIVATVYGERWLECAAPLRVLSLSGFLYCFLCFNTPAFNALGRPSYNLLTYAVQCVGNVLFFVFAAPWGIVGVATAYVLRGVATAPLAWHFMNQLQLAPRAVASGLIRSAACATIMAFGVAGLIQLLPYAWSGWVRLSFAIGAGAIIYMLLIRLFAREDMKAAARLLPRRVQKCVLLLTSTSA